MRHPAFRAVVAIVVVVACAMVARRGAPAPMPTVVGMSQLDVGYRLGEGALKVRASLVTGEVLEYSTADARDVESVLAMAQACAASPLGMSAIVEERSMGERALRAIQCSVRPAFGIARP
jgi:hypothetical protein